MEQFARAVGATIVSYEDVRETGCPMVGEPFLQIGCFILDDCEQA